MAQVQFEPLMKKDKSILRTAQASPLHLAMVTLVQQVMLLIKHLDDLRLKFGFTPNRTGLSV